MITLAHLRAAFNLSEFDPRPALVKMAPYRAETLESPYPDPSAPPPNEAGVLALVYPDDEGRLGVLLTLRNDKLRGHSGQVSFPGGRRDPTDPDFTATALRETCEELGLCNPPTEILGMMTRIYIPPSHFYVHPTVAYLNRLPSLQPNPEEVAEVFTLPLQDLFDDRLKQHDYHQFNGYRVRVPYYNVQGHKVWGATAVMLSELEHRLRAVVPSELLQTR
ncbi:MAG: CoA pyrophosphatase [Chloroflexi bacterium]|nr:MAG: CoA pyrophosphatase [Chloroflexota bacterium]